MLIFAKETKPNDLRERPNKEGCGEILFENRLGGVEFEFAVERRVLG